MSFEIKTLYFDDVTSMTHAWREHTMGRGDATWYHGAYAQVWDLEDQVMKVSGGDDMGYLSYLETMAELNIKNVHLPVIHESIYYRLTDEARKQCFMYRNRERIVTYMEKLEQPPKLRRNVWGRRGNLVKSSDPPVKYWMQGVAGYLFKTDTPAFARLSLEHQELIVLLRIAYEHYKEKYPRDFGRFDMHSGNALVRGRTFVITDPLA